MVGNTRPRFQSFGMDSGAASAQDAASAARQNKKATTVGNLIDDSSFGGIRIFMLLELIAVSCLVSLSPYLNF